MNLILSADRNGGIGKGNRLLFTAPGDMAFFREKTVGSAVVMGRATMQSLPGGQPLAGRCNVVLTKDKALSPEGFVVCHSLPELFALMRQWSGEIYVIGGAGLYRQLMPYCRLAYVTRWDAVAPADTFAPELGDGWRLTGESPVLREEGLSYRFLTYRQENPLPWRLEEQS